MSQMKINKKKKLKAGDFTNPSMIIPNLAYFQVIGNGSRGSPKCLHLFTSSFRYLFNVGEGAQRLVIEHKCKLVKLSGIFITHSSWANMGGLPGVMLCLRDNNINKIILHGPPKVENLFIMTKGFMETQSIEIEKYDYHVKNYDDGCLKIKYIPIKKDISVESHEDTKGKDKSRDIVIAYIGQLHDRLGVLDLQKCMDAGVPPNSFMLGNLKNGMDVVLDNGKIVKSIDVKGIDEPGLLFAVVECPSLSYFTNFIENPELALYHDLENREYECKSNSTDTKNGIMKELPQDRSSKLSLIVHFTPEEIVNHPSYQSFMKRFGPKTHHWMINNCTDGDISFAEMLRFQYKLNSIDSYAFPFPTDAVNRSNFIENGEISTAMLETSKSTENGLTIKPGLNLSKFSLRPLNTAGFDFTECYQTLSQFIIPDSELVEPNSQIYDKKAFENAVLSYRKGQNMGENSESYPNFVFLGTGSAVPNKTRNVSCIWVNLNAESSILLDCGEGSAGQAIRFFGSLMPNHRRQIPSTAINQNPRLMPYDNEMIDKMLLKLKGIFISHLHADHLLGIIEMINERRRAMNHKFSPSNNPNLLRNSETSEKIVSYEENFKMAAKFPPKILLIAPRSLQHFLTPYNYKHGDTIFDQIEFIPSHLLQPGAATLDENIRDRVLEYLNLRDITVFPVYHFKNPTGISFSAPFIKGDDILNATPREYKKIVYSGDTMPCENLIKHGKDADLLIHEATFEDDLENEAFTKRHSTIGQAIKVAECLQAKHLILTHYSQRYSKIPKFQSGLKPLVSQNFGDDLNSDENLFKIPNQINPDEDTNITYAFDNMRVSFETLPHLPKLREPLKILFATEMCEMNDRTERLKLRKQMAWE